MQKIFKEFEKADIEYLHFKSNTSLDYSFLGEGDFDVLINPKHLAKVEQIISSNNGKRFNAFYYGRYPGVDNWLIFDEHTGDINHFHLHCQLATGKNQVKEYVIPWNQLLLENRIKDKKWDIYISDPNLEILLLMLRIVVKSKAKDMINAWFMKYQLHKDLENEWIQLQTICDMDKVYYYIENIFSNEYQPDIKRIVQSKTISTIDYLKLNRIVRNYLSKYRRMSGFKASFQSFIQRIEMKLYRYSNRHFDACKIVKKTGLSGGAIIAFVGVDGAGKSTMTKAIQEWMQKKIECHRFYMGEGDGKNPLFVSFMKKIRCFDKSFVKTLNTGANNEKNKSNNIGGIKLVKKMLRAKMIVSIEKRNYRNIIKMNRYRLNGGISLLDRYPQVELSSRNDGPKLEQTFVNVRETLITKYFLVNEKKYLSIVRLIKPDIIFRLNITADESMKRKPEQGNILEFQKKIDDLNCINFQNANIIEIDATQPYETEILEIKKYIWGII